VSRLSFILNEHQEKYLEKPFSHIPIQIKNDPAAALSNFVNNSIAENLNKCIYEAERIFMYKAATSHNGNEIENDVMLIINRYFKPLRDQGLIREPELFIDKRDFDMSIILGIRVRDTYDNKIHTISRVISDNMMRLL